MKPVCRKCQIELQEESNLKKAAIVFYSAIGAVLLIAFVLVRTFIR